MTWGQLHERERLILADLIGEELEIIRQVGGDDYRKPILQKLYDEVKMPAPPPDEQLQLPGVEWGVYGDAPA